MFVASTRTDDRGPNTVVTPEGMHFSLDMVSVPPGHTAGMIETPAFGSPDPRRYFALGAHSPLDPDGFKQELASHISGRVGSNRDVLLFIHGFDSTLSASRLRLAQIAADGQFGGVAMLFAWPSKGSLFAYESDKDSAFASRDALEKLLTEIAAVPGVGKIHILAHSMGAWLTMEALRENAIAGDANLSGHLGEVMLAAPDIDLAVFRQELAKLNPQTQVAVFVSSHDRALGLSASLAGNRPRVGALDASNPHDRAELDRLGVIVYDVSNSSAGFLGHDTYADAPQVIRQIGAELAEPRIQDSKTVAIIDAGTVRGGDATAPNSISSSPLSPNDPTPSPAPAPAAP